jgi:transcriptional regulator with XRE-family HTH domain
VPHLGERLKELRGEKTLYEVERQTGIRRSALNSYEKGDHFPTPKTLEKLAEFYKVPYKELRILHYWDYYMANPTERDIVLAWAEEAKKKGLDEPTPGVV